MCCLLSQVLVCSVSPHQLPGSGKTQIPVEAGSGTIVRSNEGPEWLEDSWLSASWQLFLHVLKLSYCSSENAFVKWSRLHCPSAINFLDFDAWKSAMIHSSCVANCISGVCSRSFWPSPTLRYYLSLRPSSYLIRVSQVPRVRTSIDWRELWRALKCLCQALAVLVLIWANKQEHQNRRGHCTRFFRMLD